MKLYGYYRSSASYRIRILLNLKGQSWDYVPVLLNRGEQKSSEFLARNPSGLVPVLEHGDLTLAQLADHGNMMRDWIAAVCGEASDE